MKIIILDSIRSVLNVGSIFRTIDAVGDFEIWLVGITPTPLDRFGRARKDFIKTSLGAEKSVIWKHFNNEDFLKELENLKKEGVEIIAIEQDEKSIDYKKVIPAPKCAIVLGSETEGVSKDILKQANIIAEIKMNGQKESLNVSVTAGIVLYRWFDL
jgi:23S rRNA (guanosine2251-2'-O)-methyltransferase